MTLNEVRIKNFRCIEDSNAFKIGQITCLVGKNESGKTSVLHALAKLNPTDPANLKLDKDRDYPRRLLTDFDPKTEWLHTTWTLSDEDVRKVEGVLGEGALASREIGVQKTYEDLQLWTVHLNQGSIVKFLLDSAECVGPERAQLEVAQSVANLVRLAEPLKEVPAVQRILTTVNGWRNGSAVRAAIDVLDLPQFLFFSSYDRMNGNVSLEALKAAVSAKTMGRNDAVFLAFLELAGAPLDELSKLDKYESMKARVESASIKITRQIFKYWSQNRHLKVQFSLDAGRPGDLPPFNTGTVMRTRILNTLHDMTVPFDDRSAGFVWFFSFLVLFSQVKKTHGNVVILLDEPGLNLHAKAQSDLLRFINDELKPHHQVIYTAHSPFMVPSDDLASVRTVEDVVTYAEDGQVAAVLGTKVGGQVLSTDRDTLFPLQGALGYEITQSLFIGKHTLVVEGPSDILYLQAVSRELARRQRKGLDQRWTLCPAGGVDKVAAFLSLFGGNKLHVAILMDCAQGQKGRIEALRKSEMLQQGHIFTTSDFCGQPEADIEDFFGTDLYIELVNEAYGLKGANKLTIADADADASPRIVKKVEAAMRIKATAPDFDHYRSAMWLIEHPKWLSANEASRAAALDRFEAFFGKVNALLP